MGQPVPHDRHGSKAADHRAWPFPAPNRCKVIMHTERRSLQIMISNDPSSGVSLESHSVIVIVFPQHPRYWRQGGAAHSPPPPPEYAVRHFWYVHGCSTLPPGLLVTTSVRTLHRCGSSEGAWHVEWPTKHVCRELLTPLGRLVLLLFSHFRPCGGPFFSRAGG